MAAATRTACASACKASFEIVCCAQGRRAMTKEVACASPAGVPYPSPFGKGGRRRPGGISFNQRSVNGFQDSRKISIDIAIPETKNQKAGVAEIIVAPHVVGSSSAAGA
jgi:hypothetical protein